ncbi:MAG TPA: hypothetical protein VK158_00995 [Acidobacteriota bacterium]|nr:hypothetical protein [Acidobacteriota bacterium]
MDAYFDLIAKPFENFIAARTPTLDDKIHIEHAIKKLSDSPVTANESEFQTFLAAAMLHGLWAERGITDQDMHVYLCDQLKEFARSTRGKKNAFYYYQMDQQLDDSAMANTVGHARMWRRKGDSCLLHCGLFREYLQQNRRGRPSLSQARSSANTAYCVAVDIFLQNRGFDEAAEMCVKVHLNYAALEDTLYDFAKRYAFRDEWRGRDYDECGITPREKDLYEETPQGTVKRKLI